MSMCFRNSSLEGFQCRINTQVLLSWNPGSGWLYVATVELNLHFLICWAPYWADGGFPLNVYWSLLIWVIQNSAFVMLSVEQNPSIGFSFLKSSWLALSVCLPAKMGWRLGTCNSLPDTTVRFKAHDFISRLGSVCEFSTECLKGSEPNWYQENIYFWGMNNSSKSHFCISLISGLE